MGYTIYRLTVDNGNVEDCEDYTSLLDAEQAFKKVARKKTTFRAYVQAYDAISFRAQGGKIYNYDK